MNNLKKQLQQAKDKTFEIKKIEVAYQNAIKVLVPEAEAHLKNLTTARAEILADAVVYGEPQNANEAHVIINEEIAQAEKSLKEAQRSDIDSSALAEAIHNRLVIALNELENVNNAILNERKALISTEIKNIEERVIKTAEGLIDDVMQLEYFISIGNARNLFNKPRNHPTLPATFNLPLIAQDVVINPQYRHEVHLKTHEKITKLLNYEE